MALSNAQAKKIKAYIKALDKLIEEPKKEGSK